MRAAAGVVSPGCVALGLRGGELRYLGVAGTLASHAAAGALTDVAVDEDTRYDLASLTKVLSTTTLVAQSVAEGRLALDDALPDPLAPADGPAPRLAELLEHAAGLAAHREYFHAPWSLAVNQPEAMLAAIRATARDCPPQTRAIYSDLGFILLGRWLELVHERPLDALFHERVAEPLGLAGAIGFRRISASTEAPADSSKRPIAPTEVYDAALHGGARQHWYAIRETLGQGMAHGVVHDDNCLVLDGVGGHAGLFGTAAAVAAIGQAWLDGLPLVARERHPELLARFSQPSRVAGSTRRLGFDGQDPSGGGSTGGALSPASFGHLGFTGTSLWIDPAPSARSVHVLLTNRVHPSRGDAGLGIRALRPQVHRLLAAR
nr:serine hydrolase domain-containing protein [Pseudenhygromyxa sp. WMMC2535]